MRSLTRRHVISFAALGGLLRTSAAWPQSQTRAVATFSILGDLVSNVGGDLVQLTTLVGPNGDVHVYAPTPRDVKTVATANVVFVNGLGLEGWLNRLIAASATHAPVVVASRGVKARNGASSHDHATSDPHAWQSVANAEIYVGNIRDGLIAADPAGEKIYQANAAAYLAKLHAQFPHESAALDAFFAEVREAYLLGLVEHFRGREMARLAPYRDLTVSQAIDRRFADRELKLLLTADCAHWGSPPCRTSFVFDSMLRLSYFLGNYYPQGGSQAFADELARCFEERGGHILMSTMVRRIVVEGGAGGAAGLAGGAGKPFVACGVALETLRGTVHFQGAVRCGAVVSNADLLGTLETLVGAEHLPPGTLQRLHALRPTFPCWLTHLGLAGVPAEVLEQAQGYHWDDWDTDRVGRDALRFKLFVPTLYEPAMAPPGGQVLIVQKVQEMDYAAVTDWPLHKQQVESFVFGHLARLIPGIADKIVVRTSASAQTAWRFTLNHQGAMLGWEMSPGQLGAGRPDLASPVRNLFFAGHWVKPGGGITPVIVSAQHAAQAVAGAIARRERLPRPAPDPGRVFEMAAMEITRRELVRV